MNFLNPYFSIYFDDPVHKKQYPLPYVTELSWIFLRNLENSLPEEVQRVNILLTTEREHGRTLKLNKVYEYYHSLNILDIESQDTIENRLKFLSIMSTAFLKLGKEFGWDLKAIKLAVKRTEKQPSGFEYISGYRTSSSKQFTGRLRLNLNVDKLLIRTIITNLTDNSDKEFNLLICNEKHFSWNQSVREFGWYDEQHFGLKFHKGDIWILVNIENGTINHLIKPRPRKQKNYEKFLEELIRL